MEILNYNLQQELANSIDNMFKIAYGNNIEENFYKCRLEIIEKILEYEKNDDINPTTFMKLVDDVNKIAIERKYYGTCGSYTTKGQHPSYKAAFIRWYHKEQNHIYFKIKYSNKLDKYVLKYDFYLDDETKIEK